MPSPQLGLSEELSKAHSDKFAVVLLSLAGKSCLNLHFAGVAASSQFWGKHCRFVLSQEELFGFTTISNQSYHKKSYNFTNTAFLKVGTFYEDESLLERRAKADFILGLNDDV